jgi:formate dehydrogenase major subunit
MPTASLHGATWPPGPAAGTLVGVALAPRQVTLQGAPRRRHAAGTVFIPFAYVEAAANLLTNAALDPFGKIPEFKYCAVRVRGANVGSPRCRRLGR